MKYSAYYLVFPPTFHAIAENRLHFGQCKREQDVGTVVHEALTVGVYNDDVAEIWRNCEQTHVSWFGGSG